MSWPSSTPEHEEGAMDIPERLVIADAAYASDGGSLWLRVRGPAGASCAVVLWQHLFLDSPDPQRLPGRLYVDGALVPVRSDAERRLLIALREARLEPPPPRDVPPRGPGVVVGRDLQEYDAKIAEGPEAATRHLVEKLIAFVESEEYVALAGRLGE
jgi:hypothetical protein